MTEKGLYFKDKLDNYSTLDKKEKFEIFRELMDLGLYWVRYFKTRRILVYEGRWI